VAYATFDDALQRSTAAIDRFEDEHGGRDVTDIGEALGEGVERLEALPGLLVIPALVTLLSVSDLQAVLARRGTGSHFGVEFTAPVPIGDLWTFVNVPDAGAGGVTITPPGLVDTPFPLLMVLAGSVLYFILYGVLAAGYLGSIQASRRDGEYDFLTNVRRYTLTYVGLSLVIFGVGLVAVAFAFVFPPVLFLAFPVILAIGYLFWGAWFLVPVADLEATAALGQSYRLDVSESDYVLWTLAHLVIGGVVSLVTTPIVVNTSVVGVVLGLAVVVPIGFILTVASLRVIDDLADRSEPNQEPDDAFETY